MAKWLESRILWGSLLILAGILFLLQNIFAFQFGDIFWTIILGLAGLFFLSVFISNRAQWWSLIPGVTLLSIALMILLSTLFPEVGELLSGSIVLGGIGLSFLLIYLTNREHWWTIIPAGVLLTLALVVGLESLISESDFISIFFVGLGITFAVVAILPTAEGKMRWAWIPAGILVLMGLLFSAFTGDLVAYLWPAALIVAGLYLIFRTFSSKK